MKRRTLRMRLPLATPRQPFSANAINKLGLSLTHNFFDPLVVKFTLHNIGEMA